MKQKEDIGLPELTNLAQTMFLERCYLWDMLSPLSPDNRHHLSFCRVGQQ